MCKDTRCFLTVSPRVTHINFVGSQSQEPAVGMLLTGELRCGCQRNTLKMKALKVGQRFTDVEAMGCQLSCQHLRFDATARALLACLYQPVPAAVESDIWI
ncbi:hypothetical protein QQF64_010476 [Cirrhinus molitorella]|uniref:Uncharacterized protein n=1 Tax=Cirrhinus molitorella TaxID=172907 RepID=A0ABR3M787_9TELE